MCDRYPLEFFESAQKSSKIHFNLVENLKRRSWGIYGQHFSIYRAKFKFRAKNLHCI
jgi:hypothetical protein